MVGSVSGAIGQRVYRAATTARLAYAERGLLGAGTFLARTARRKAVLLMRHLLAHRRRSEMRATLRAARAADPAGVPRIAVAVTGGIGDFLVAARFLGDLGAEVGGTTFDIFSSRPAVATWAFGRVPGFAAAHYDVLFDGLRPEYDLAMRASQFVVA